MAPQQNSGLRLPQQDLERCSMFDADGDAVAAWVDQLPMGSPARAGTELRAACAELNRVGLAPELRFRLLELLRAPAHSVITALTRGCLNQPIVLDTQRQAQADTLFELGALLATGYTIVAVHTIRGDTVDEQVNPARLACEALHRAVVHSGQRILNTCLLYQAMAQHSWAGLHQLYALAERQQLVRLPVEDPLRETQSTIVQEYLPPLLLACSKPNQLRQHDIAGAYRAFREWNSMVELQDPELGEGLFAVDMSGDQGPVFAELLVRRGSTQFRYINTSRLVTYLEELKQARGREGLRVIEFDRHTRLDTNLLEHLIKSLGEISQRSFARRDARISLQIAAGISNVHYHIAGERTLMQVMHGDDYESPSDDSNPFLRGQSHAKADLWQQANPEEDVPEHEPDAETALPVEAGELDRTAEILDRRSVDPQRHHVHSVRTTNTSPGGYCVEWEDPPEGIHIGDIVCVREADGEHGGHAEHGDAAEQRGHGDSAEEAEQIELEAPAGPGDWTIAVIRWVSQVKHAPTLLGLELLSPRGSAYAAQVKMENGEMSRPIRVLLLPEIALVGQANTLVLPRMVFREGQRITLTRQEDAFLVKLKRLVTSTSYFSQMDFDYIRQLDDDRGGSRRPKLATNVFDSVWNDI
jgi:hypothetical protein